MALVEGYAFAIMIMTASKMGFMALLRKANSKMAGSSASGGACQAAGTMPSAGGKGLTFTDTPRGLRRI